MTVTGWVFWSGTIGLDSSLEARFEAAAAGGFTRLSVSPLDVASADVNPRELGERIRGAGFDVVLDGFLNWYDGEPLTASPSTAFTTDEILTMCAALRPVSLTVLGRPTIDVPLESVAASFGVLCDRLVDEGVAVQLEFMPFMAIADLAQAWAIVAAADRPNGGLLFDTWHFYRGNPDFATLESVPGDRVFAVQVADGSDGMPDDVARDTFHRRLPGDGGFDLARVLRVLDRIGALTWVGPEVISPTTAAMAPADAGRLAADRVRTLITEVTHDG